MHPLLLDEILLPNGATVTLTDDNALNCWASDGSNIWMRSFKSPVEALQALAGYRANCVEAGVLR